MRNNKLFITAFAVFMTIIMPFLCVKAQEPSGGTGLRQDGMKINKPDRDTIRVVMLVCDTTSSSWVDSGIVKGKLVQIGEKHTRHRDPSAVWAYGYSVREFAGYYNGNTTQNAIYLATPVYQHIEYLGDDKKPLINKIVWMAKEVPQ